MGLPLFLLFSLGGAVLLQSVGEPSIVLAFVWQLLVIAADAFFFFRKRVAEGGE